MKTKEAVTTVLAIETRALRVGIVINLIMAFAGWVAFYLSNSEALLLDGTFSFINAISTCAAIVIVKRKSERSERFPFGLFAFEAVYVLLKGILLFGVILIAVVSNVVKIIGYFSGATLSRLSMGPITVYTVMMIILCFGLATFYYRQNKIIGHKSQILKADVTTAKTDGLLSLSVGLVLVMIVFIPEKSVFGFLHFIGDAILVVILCLLMIRKPLSIVKSAFFEIIGETLSNGKKKQFIHTIITEYVPSNFSIENSIVMKTGSSYFVVVYLTQKQGVDINIENIRDYRSVVHRELISQLQELNLEVIVR